MKKATYQGITREWLYWFDENGKRFLTPEERMQQSEEKHLESERKHLESERKWLESEKKANKLAEMLKKHKGGFLMTYNNCSAVRDLYGDCKFEYPEWQYTYGQGETRIGKNRQITTNDNIKESHEIIIIKWPVY